MSATQGTLYGRLPGVRAEVIGGGLANVQIGREQKLVVFGRGDPQAGTAAPNEPAQVQTRVDIARTFGSGTELTEGIQKALRNKGNIEYIYGVMPEEIDVSGEPIAGGSGVLENEPIVEDPAYLTVTNTITATEETPEFRYESPPTAPDESGVVAINPNTGEVEAGDTDDYEIDYAYLDWESALDAADTVLNHSEVGVYATLSDSVAVAELLETKLDGINDNPGIRREYKLAMGISGAQPNMTTADGEGGIDAGSYTDPIDSDSVFLAGPARVSDAGGRTLIGGIAGRMAGNELTNPLHGDTILGYGPLTQALTRNDEDLLRDANIIPVVDDYRDGEGGITVEGNSATSSATDWNRTFQNRRIADLVLLILHEIGEAARNNLMRDQQLEDIESNVIDQYERLARAGLIAGDPDGTEGGGSQGTNPAEEEDQQQPYFVDVVRIDQETIGIETGFSPTGVTTGVDETITIADVVGDLADAPGAGTEEVRI